VSVTSAIHASGLVSQSMSHAPSDCCTQPG
jgi:hypothetical protein